MSCYFMRLNYVRLHKAVIILRSYHSFRVVFSRFNEGSPLHGVSQDGLVNYQFTHIYDDYERKKRPGSPTQPEIFNIAGELLTHTTGAFDMHIPKC